MSNIDLLKAEPSAIAYLAGFFDAEGCVIITGGNNKSYNIVCSVSQKGTDILNIYQDNFCGNVNIVNKFWNVFAWKAYGKYACAFLELIAPYLIVKKKQVDVAIDFYYSLSNKSFDRYKEISYKEDMKFLIHKLKRKAVKQKKPLLIRTHSEEEIFAYLGGFFDGEGCVTVSREKIKYREGYWYRLRCSVAQCCRIPLDLLCSLFGGSIKGFWWKRRRKKDGLRSYHHVWTILTQDAKVFLEAIRPFVLLKREQIDLALAFQKIVKPNSGGMYGRLTEGQIVVREAICILLKHLKHEHPGEIGIWA